MKAGRQSWESWRKFSIPQHFNGVHWARGLVAERYSLRKIVIPGSRSRLKGTDLASNGRQSTSFPPKSPTSTPLPAQMFAHRELLDQKLFRTIRISDPSTDPESTLCLLSKALMQERQINHLWDLHFVDRQVQAALRRLFSSEGEPSAAVIRLLGRQIPSLTAGEIKASLRRIEIQISCSVTMEPSKPTKPKLPNKPDVLKPVDGPKSKTNRPSAPTAIGVSLKQLIDAQVISAPLKLFKKYKGAELSAIVLADGSVEFDGQKFDSCSSAATFARGKIVGGTPATNGWDFWKYQDTAGKTHLLDHARQLFRDRSQKNA